mgnify:CR=1 FL=1|jgi:hypothetical protein
MNYSEIRQNQTQFLSLTSLTIAEFDYMCHEFDIDWQKYYRYHTLEGKKRAFPSYCEHGNSQLSGTCTKLFFLLNYLKTNNLQQQQAANFGISQSKVSRVSSILLMVLNQTLKRMGLIPIRNGYQLKEQLQNHPDCIFTYDGIERGILRNSAFDAQEDEYSGKKKSMVSKI